MTLPSSIKSVLLPVAVATVVLLGCSTSEEKTTPAEAREELAQKETTQRERPAPEQRSLGEQDSVFISAVRLNRVAEVRAHLESGADVDATRNGRSVLASVAIRGHTEIAQLLIEAGADVNWTGGEPLQFAMHEGHTEITDLLLEAGADYELDASTFKGAARVGKTQIMQQVLAAGAASIDEGGTAAMTNAAKGGHLETVQFLLDKGADVNPEDEKAMTPLMVASGEGHTQIVELLLERGAEVNRVLERWGGPDSGGNYTALLGATMGAHTDIVRLLLRTGADADRQANNTYCRTALAHALASGDPEIVRMMMQAGAELNYGPEAFEESGARNCRDSATFVAAASGGFTGIVEQMLEQGARPNAGAGYKSSDSPLALAAANGHSDTARLLLEAGADVESWAYIDGVYRSALMGAALNGHKDVVELLIEAGADVEKESSFGETALKLAVSNGHADIAELLRAAGADK